jgi:hypothetical protein
MNWLCKFETLALKMLCTLLEISYLWTSVFVLKLSILGTPSDNVFFVLFSEKKVEQG